MAFLNNAKSEKVNVLVYGAGVSGLITKRTISKDRLINQKIIGFLDDNRKLHNTRLEGTRIYSSDKLEALAEEFEIKTLIIVISSTTTTIKLTNHSKSLIGTVTTLDTSVKQ